MYNNKIMPINCEILKKSSCFDKTVFNFMLIPYERNDMNPFDEIWLLVEFYQSIDVKTWDNKLFKQFIEDIKKNNNVETSFTYMIWNIETETWYTKDGKIHMNVWDDPGYLYTNAFVYIDDVIIKKLESLYDAIEAFNKTNK